MLLLEAKQRYCAVGQGLFYWGNFQLGRFDGLIDRFTYIFDCGSSSKKIHIQKEITYLVPQVPPSNPINLLMISHLDYDHVSGLDILLQNTKVQTVVLPYLDPAERLLLLIGAPPRNEWYKEFLLSPSSFLRNKKVSAIAYITRGNNDDIFPPPKSQENRLYNESQFHLDVNKMEDDQQIHASALEHDLEETNHTVFKKDSRPLSLFPFWQFMFYVSPKPDIQVEHLNQSVKATFPGDSIPNILRDKRKRRILASRYRKAFQTKDLNTTCLACMHGPIFVGLLPWCGPASSSSSFPFAPWLAWSPIGYKYWNNFHYRIGEMWEEWVHERQRHGLQNYIPDYTYLMGDLSANQEWERLNLRFQNYIQRIQMFQVPHHGAKMSWNNAIPQSLPGVLFIISAGLKNRFGHPHPEVIESLSDAGLAGNVRWVNEITSVVDYRVFPLPN